MTYFALILAAIDNDKPLSEYLKSMEANNIGLSETQRVKILLSLAHANNNKHLSSVRFSAPFLFCKFTYAQISRSCVSSLSTVSVTRFEI